MKRVHPFYILFFALVAMFCFKAASLCINTTTENLSFNKDTNQETWVTVFVHGIVGITPHLSIKNIFNLVVDDVLNTEYALAVELTRGDPFFFKLQPMAQLGLIPIDKKQKGPHASVALATIMDSFEAIINQKTTNNNDYYTFGWSGLATHSARLEAGKQLYYSLEKLTKKYQCTQNITPKIRVIGYSHGGNVVLNLGAVQPLNYQKHSFTVDELVLLGTPILCESDFYVQSKLFKEILHIYSRGDRVQFVDCFSYKRFFSNKTFKERSKFILPKNLRQIQVRFTDKIKTRFQTDTIDDRIKTAFDPAVITGSARFLRDRSPGHLELWYFGWLPKGYRASNIIYPLPTCALLPFILNAAKTYGSIEPNESLIVDVRPRYEQIIVRQQYHYASRILMPFLSFDQLKQLNKKLACYQPENVTEEMQDDHVYRWCNIAQKEFKTRRKKHRKKRRRRHRTAQIDLLELL